MRVRNLVREGFIISFIYLIGIVLLLLMSTYINKIERVGFYNYSKNITIIKVK